MNQGGLYPGFVVDGHILYRLIVGVTKRYTFHHPLTYILVKGICLAFKLKRSYHFMVDVKSQNELG